MIKLINITATLLLILICSNSFAAMYKCVNSGGETIFQGKPCSKQVKQTEIKYKGKKFSQLEQCNIACNGTYSVCIRKQKGNFFNKRGTKICKAEKEACDVTCVDPEQGKILSELAEIDREAYTSDIRHTNAINRNESRRQYEKQERQCKNSREELDRTKEKWLEIKRFRYSDEKEQFYTDKIYRLKEAVRINC